MKKLIAVAVFAAAAPASAETVSDLASGARVRVRIVNADRSRTSLTGRLLEATDGTLTIQPAKGAPVTVPLRSLDRFDRSLGRRSSGMGILRGAGVGLASGIVAGAVVGAVSTNPSPGPACPTSPVYGDEKWTDLIACGWGGASRSEGAAIGAVLYGTAGAIVGGIAGGISPGERWQKASAERVRLSVGPRQGGLGAGVQVSF